VRQAVMTQPGTIEHRDVPAPRPGPGEVLLRVKRIGVCGSDVHVWHGQHPFTPYPVVQGHEFSAVIEDVGPDVTGLSPGQRATAAPQVVCGRCGPCRRGDYHICDRLKVRGFQAPGCAQDLFVTEAYRLVPFPDTITLDEGAVIEPVAVAAHCTARAGDLTGRNVVVLGAGPIGNLVAQAARCRGARQVLITDISDFRLGKATAVGIDAACNVSREPLAERAQAVFGSDGFNVAFECAGVESSLDDAVQSIQKGGLIVAVAVYGGRPRVDMAVLNDRELTITGTLMYQQRDYQQAVAWLESGRVKVTSLITRHFPFEAYADAYRYIDQHSNECLKVLIDL
jgi:2-desacetyl-2-hydroxyethyl bacteriochlorophyllide A dehydrogenase